MTPEQKIRITQLAADWAFASFARGNAQGLSDELVAADRDAAERFRAYMDGLK